MEESDTQNVAKSKFEARVVTTYNGLQWHL